MFSILCLSGCIIKQTEPVKEPPKKEEVVESKPSFVPWPQEKKEYWYAKYFLSMAMNPNVQRMLTPETVFDIVRCTVNQLEKDYKYEKFLTDIGNNMMLPNHISQYIYQVSYVCSQLIKKKMGDEELNPAIKIIENWGSKSTKRKKDNRRKAKTRKDRSNL